jgi:hypothetical protein
LPPDNVLDLTKGTFYCPQTAFLTLTFIFLEWLVEDVPLQEIGRITLVQNPYGFVVFDVHAPQLTFSPRTNHFAEVEQIGFDPANMVCFFKGPRINKADFT